ncbi:antibiotic acetyltransferase [Brucella endophytica]|uniref:Antibiotic acetyltransferase n=1 Tax=Brucella endophytica TaxID=1963359 RepID=A0A916WH97_9HYPH|nr:DapH/DapD/GlmU-related protein [Brucella endophytica]GGA97468.1 antibiotic acetyltransferase [Brucella endophytica]
MNDEKDLRFQNDEPRIHPTAQLKGVKLGRYADIGERVILRDVTVGDFSYFERNGEGIYADIGRFCSVAANVRINALEHPMERLTTHKVSYRPNEYFRYLGLDSEFRARRQARRVRIGHDVWIGHGAVIMPGVSIGSGAVVGANAVVTRDVAPYTIVAGSPACLIRPRFEPAIVKRLLTLCWWDWPVEKLYEAVPDMQKLDIEAFLDKWA